MTLGEACKWADRLAGNQIPMELKVKWLSDLDGTVHKEILLRHQGTCQVPFSGYDGGTDPETPLLVGEPYDGIYRWYLEMQIHNTNGEILKYNNAAKNFNSALLAFGDYVNRSHLPLGMAGLKLI